MPKGFVKLERRGGGAPFFVAVHTIARFGQYHPTGSYVVCTTMDEGENDTILVAPEPDELAAMIEAAQHDRPQRSEFAQAMGGAVAAFGGGR